MVMSPKKTKYKKFHRGRMTGVATRGNKVTSGEYGLQALQSSWITSRQIEATRRTISRYTKRKGKLWIKIFPDKSITSRAKDSRMGAGKGSVEYWVATVKPGTVMFELSGLSNKEAQDALNLAAYKLPIKTKIILKEINY
jgi:large subunit ribosomal protein L16